MRNKKHLVSKEAYFIAQKIYFLWPAKKFILLSNKFRYFRYFLWQKNTLWFDLFHPLFERDGAICKLIPRLWISDLFVIGYNFVLIIVWMMTRFFPVVSGEIIYPKIRFPRNFKFYPTLITALLHYFRFLALLLW